MKNILLNKKSPSRLTATQDTRYEERSGIRRKMVRCVCVCGNEKWVRSDYLASGETKSCGQCKVQGISTAQGHFPLLTTGALRGGWVVIGPAPKKRENGQIVQYYECFCLCGRKAILSAEALRATPRKKQKVGRGCGCKTNTHDVPLYRTWDNFKANHRNKKQRETTLCPLWYRSFGAFFVWSLQNGYAPKATLQRRNLSKNLTPENAYWTETIKRGAFRNAFRTTAPDGTLTSLRRLYDALPPEKRLVGYDAVLRRVKRGATIEEALDPNYASFPYQAFLGKTVGGIVISSECRPHKTTRIVTWRCLICGTAKEEAIINIMRRSSRQKDAENPILCPACHLKHLNQEALALTEESLKAEREKQHVEQEILRHHRQAQNDLYQAAHEKWRACVSRYKALKKRKERPDDYYAQLAAATAEADAALTEQNRLRDELRQGVLVVDPILGDCVIYRRPGPPRKYPLPAPQVTA